MINKITLERGKVWNLNDLPTYSIALDGAVSGPKFDNVCHRYSFDHHANCIRSITMATTYQVWTSIILGLDTEKFSIFISDVDSDVCCSVWLLKNPGRVNEPLVKKIVDAVSLGDMFAGAIPLNGMTKTVEWISSPQTESLKNGDYNKLSNDGLLTILESILHRMTLYVDGEASQEISEHETHNEFKILRNENDWVLVESNEPHVYQQLYHSGFDRIVLMRKQSDGSLAISLAKRSDFIDNFPLEKMYEEFNKLEPGWGGSSSCGGSVRNSDGSRSHLPLSTIIEVVNACVENRHPKVKTKKKTKI